MKYNSSRYREKNLNDPILKISNLLFHTKFLIICCLTLISPIASAQFTLASDNAGNPAYNGGFGGSGQNGGSGFNNWLFTYGGNTGSFKGNPANDGMGTTGIGTTTFGFFATGTNYVYAARPFSLPFEINDELSFYWAMNFDANTGAKGFNLRNGNTTIFNVNNNGNSTITTSTGTANTVYGTQPMLVKVLKTLGDNYNFSMTSRSGGATYSSSFSSSNILNGIEIYMGNQTDGAGQRNIYFNFFTIFNSGQFNISSGIETYTKSLSGTGAITKYGAGTLVLTGSHTYSNGTSVNGGILQLGNGGITGSVSGNITNNASLTFNHSNTQNYGGIISGSGSLTKQGPGTLILTGDNNYSGGTTVTAGTLQLGNGSTSNGIITGNVLNNGAIIFNRTGTINSTVVISGTGTWTKQGNSNLSFTQNQTFIGNTFLNAGTLTLDKNIANSQVTVNNGATLRITGTDVKLKGLIVNSGGIVIIEPGKGLTLTENLVVNGSGSVVLESTSTIYSSLLVNGTTSGTISYKRNVNANSTTGGNDLIASPVSGQNFGNFAANNPNIVTDPNDATRKLFGPFEKSNGVFLLYRTTDNAGTPLVAGEGYRAGSTGGTFTFTGTPNSGTINRTIINSGTQFAKWNLVGNPYPTYLYVQEETTGPNTHGGFLNANLSQLDPSYSYIYGYDNDESDGNKYTLWNLANTTSSTVITPGQGFFLAAPATGGTISFTPNMRTIGSTDDFIIGRLASQPLTYLKLKLSNSTSQYITDFYFNNNSTLGLDQGYDAGIFGANTPVFSIHSKLVEENTGIDMQLQSLPFSSLTSEVVIPLKINAGQGQQLTVSISDSSLPDGINVYLEDVFSGASTLLNATNYVFNTTTNLNGVGRFYLRFVNSTLSNSEFSSEDVRILSTQYSKTLFVYGRLTEESKLSVYDLQGRLVLKTDLNSNKSQNQVDISYVNTGIYVVKVSTNNSQVTKKIIIR